jgi:tRNA modification GTPase
MSLHVDTIAALSTPPGESGIAVVRVSGPEACAVVGAMFHLPAGGTLESFEHRRLYHGRMVSKEGDSPDGRAGGGDRGCGRGETAAETIDEVVLAVFRAPESYTGEDVIEVSCHGGPVVVSRLLEGLYQAGVAAAEPGEFTKRAFLNGKMDLIQAEAVADIIHARSELQQRVAQRQLEGGLSGRIGALADETLELLGIIEANIDFIEEGIESIDWDASVATVAGQGDALRELLESAPAARRFHTGFEVVIAGPVNAGKSSLYNALAGEARAIVTEIPGTTRDVLRETIVLDGLVFVLHDTAGLRTGTGDRVEEIGIDLAVEAVGRADVVLFVVDGSEPLASDAAEVLRRLEPERVIVAMNKSDLEADADTHHIIEGLEGREVVPLSARTGDGMHRLRSAMLHRVGGEALSAMARERFVLNTRLVTLLDEALRNAGVLEAGLRDRKPLELLAADTRALLAGYEEATGRRYSDGLLDVIFSRFCLGK